MKTSWDEILNKINSRMAQIQMPPVELGGELEYAANRHSVIDGYLKVFNKKRPFEYKKNFRLAQIPMLQQRFENNEVILLADYLPSPVADALLENGIEFADRAGNLFLKGAGTFILIHNCKKSPELAKQETQGRAFTPTGIKVLFLLLTEPESLSWSYRKINEYTGVSIGSIQYIMADLQDRKYLVQLQGKFHIPDRPLLLERWTNAYLDKLYGKCETEKYEGELSVSLDKFPVSLTGETAAEELHLMKSAKTVMYRWGNINELIVRNRWKKNPQGPIEIRTAFWPESRVLKPLAPCLLIYADLLAENDSRCTEIAKAIYDKYLKAQAQ